MNDIIQSLILIFVTGIVLYFIFGEDLFTFTTSNREEYTAASKFNPSKDIYIPGMKADGTIVLTHKFKDIGDAIDTAAGSIKTDYVAADTVALNAAKAHADYHRNAFSNWANGPNGYVLKKSLPGIMDKQMKNKYDPRYIKKDNDYKMLVAGGPQTRYNTYVLARHDGLLTGGGSSGRAFRFLDMDTRDYEGVQPSAGKKMRKGGTGADYNYKWVGNKWIK